MSLVSLSAFGWAWLLSDWQQIDPIAGEASLSSTNSTNQTWAAAVCHKSLTVCVVWRPSLSNEPVSKRRAVQCARAFQNMDPLRKQCSSAVKVCRLGLIRTALGYMTRIWLETWSKWYPDRFNALFCLHKIQQKLIC